MHPQTVCLHQEIGWPWPRGLDWIPTRAGIFWSLPLARMAGDRQLWAAEVVMMLDLPARSWPIGATTVDIEAGRRRRGLADDVCFRLRFQGCACLCVYI